METIIKIRISNTKVVLHHIEATHHNSYSGLLQLNESLRLCDEDFLKQKVKIVTNKGKKKRVITVSYQSQFNMEFLVSQQEKYNFLQCAYCGRKDLVIFPFGTRYIKGVKRDQMATCDHILPRSLYPELALDVNNLTVACEKCNHKKGIKIIKPKFKL